MFMQIAFHRTGKNTIMIWRCFYRSIEYLALVDENEIRNRLEVTSLGSDQRTYKYKI